jgi:uncharacterized membrane protein (UPF0127 family)
MAPAHADPGTKFFPFWVQTFVPTQLWSGTDGNAEDFGPVPQFTYLRVVSPPVALRFHVYDPRDRNYAYVDASSVGPSGPLLQPLIFVNDRSEMASLQVELAVTPEALQFGLMGRSHLDSGDGMLFDLPDGTSDAFWMEDTLIPLSIAFIDRTGRLLDIQTMAPLTRDLHESPAPYHYAVEVNTGWFLRQGIAPGDTMELPGWLDGAPVLHS